MLLSFTRQIRRNEMGIEIVIMWIGLGLVGGFVVDKGVGLYKHNDNNDVAMYEACVKYAKEVKECRNLEDQ
jgi:hypothetical protein